MVSVVLIHNVFVLSVLSCPHSVVPSVLFIISGSQVSCLLRCPHEFWSVCKKITMVMIAALSTLNNKKPTLDTCPLKLHIMTYQQRIVPWRHRGAVPRTHVKELDTPCCLGKEKVREGSRRFDVLEPPRTST